jgi:ubiquinone/menaquinone biosynthesis C-methylase UbiE
MARDKDRVCPVEMAGHLDNRMRRWLQNPRKILGPYIREGMTVLDVGCGPGFFALEAARMAGSSGRVIALDLQEEMLQKVKNKILGTDFEDRITLHKCEKSTLGLSAVVDFILAFYMVHEVPDQERFFSELYSMLKSQGQLLVVEPPMHTSRKAFQEMIEKAERAGFIEIARPSIFLNKCVVFQKK